MSRLFEIRIALAVMALIVWGYGVRADEPNTRLVGIALFVAALLLRFLRPRPRGADPSSPGES